MSAFCLDIHAEYRCRHAGACCDSWTVPAEPEVVELVRTTGLSREGVTGALFLSSTDARGHGSWTVARDTGGNCVFFDRAGGGLCIIHRDLGVEALPSACRHFPRKVLHDARGTLISLSHFCPTAAATLLTPGKLATVEARPPLRLASPMEGLDASEALPPLLRPDLLCDMEGYDAWERAGVAIFAHPTRGYVSCLDYLAGATESIREWTPEHGPLAHRIRSAFSAAAVGSPSASDQDRAIRRVAALTSGRAGDDLAQIADFQSEWDRRAGHLEWFDGVMKQYLAARLFGNWIAYQGRGLRSIVEWLRTCAAVVRHFLLERAVGCGREIDVPACIEAVRSADLLLLHVLDSESFARHVATIEEADSA